MDPIEVTYDSMDQVPEPFRDLYSEKDGKAVLTGVNGLKTQQDVNNVQEALRKEREDHRKAQDALKSWKTLGNDPSELQQKLDKIGELEAAADGKLDENKIQQMVEARLGQKTAPLERQLKTLSEEKETAAKERDTLKQVLERRDLNDAVRQVATEMKVVPTAMPDVEMVAAHYLERDETSGNFIVKSDANGVTPGIDVKGFLKEMQKLRPHWWPASSGGGAGGGGPGGGNDADNPWSAKGWNVTRQGAFIREHGMAQAEQAAKSAGSKVGATRPPQSK